MNRSNAQKVSYQFAQRCDEPEDCMHISFDVMETATALNVQLSLRDAVRLRDALVRQIPVAEPATR